MDRYHRLVVLICFFFNIWRILTVIKKNIYLDIYNISCWFMSHFYYLSTCTMTNSCLPRQPLHFMLVCEPFLLPVHMYHDKLLFTSTAITFHVGLWTNFIICPHGPWQTFAYLDSHQMACWFVGHFYNLSTCTMTKISQCFQLIYISLIFLQIIQ